MLHNGLHTLVTPLTRDQHSREGVTKMNGDFPRDEFIRRARIEGHSEEFIRQTQIYIDALEDKQMPVIFSLKHFSEIIDIPYSELENIIFSREKYYGLFKLEKKRGGKREIRCPNSKLKSIQRWILRQILDKIPTHNSCKGFRKGASISQNALPHLHASSILKVDLFHFFDSISERRVYSVFKSAGYHPNLAVELAKLCTFPANDKYENAIIDDPCYPSNFQLNESYLPQGAPTSPALANLVVRGLDIRLSSLATSLGAHYTRYADDLTFSGEFDALPKIRKIKEIVREEGFFLNNSKTSLRQKGQQQKVTGLIVSGNQLRVPKKYKREISKHIHFARKFGPQQHLRNISSDRASFQDWLLGKIMFVRSIEPNVGEDMLVKFNQIDWPFYD